MLLLFMLRMWLKCADYCFCNINRLPEGARKPVVAQCVVVTEAVVEARPSSPTSSKGQDLLLSSSPLGKEDLFSSSPTPPPNSLVSPYSTHNPLLEDLHSISLSGEEEWGDGKRRGSSGENSTSWVQFGCEEEELIQKTTSDRLNLTGDRICCKI